ncbi:hypothetical protein PVAP13_4KG106500 [Panicum virgatum]|uniref:Uncharacterized protein n=1 Tax=Panicum virgatum TaxID=38727 RepID=A0A8T0TUL4_PANVG|nr:hypothetical protein PVAP13_4KG106500 [Panicum virgatum]
MAGPSSPWPCDYGASSPFSPMAAMESSTAATPPRPDMKDSKFSVPRSRRISSNELPLVHCKDYQMHFLKAFIARMKKNYGRQFYGRCGYPFWEWEEGYEQYLVDSKLVPPDYQLVFESTKMPRQVPIVENKPNCGESSHEQ